MVLHQTGGEFCSINGGYDGITDCQNLVDEIGGLCLESDNAKIWQMNLCVMVSRIANMGKTNFESVVDFLID